MAADALIASVRPDPTHTVGQVIGPYRLVSPLGRGGTAEVWEAVFEGARGFRSTVALKLLRAGVSEAQRAAQIREARFGALLHHPNVVTTYELGERGDTLYIAMELVRGPAASVLVTEARASPRVVLDIGVQVCAGLEHIHGLVTEATPTGLVHGDVKPANLLLDRTSGQVKITDLGISAVGGGAAPVMAGTPGYVAPEQLDGRAIDGRTDVFGLGATLSALATGSRPFGSGAPITSVFQVEDMLDRGPMLARVDAAVPGLGEIVRRCMRADPADRWSSAAELGDALAILRLQQPAGPTLRDHLETLAPMPPASDLPTPSDHPTRPTATPGFVGRTAELATLTARLGEGERLITLVGLGGVGKSRMAHQAALATRERFPGGTWFLDVCEARSPNGACFAIARELGIELFDGDPVRQVGHALAARGRALFVLDNVEHLVDHAADTVGEWLTAAPEASFLATSRVALLAGERRVLLEGLNREEGVALFAARVGRPLTDAERAEAAELVDAVDGLPLAIELAAARSRRPDAVEDHRPLRHQSLAASVEASRDLLTPWAAAALVQLAVFADGFRIEAAAAVVDPHPWSGSASVVDAVHELVDASLVRFDPVNGRFRVPMVVRLHQTADSSSAAAEVRHGAYFAQFGSVGALRALETRGGIQWQDLGHEVENLMVASARAVARGDGECAAGCALAIEAVLSRQGPVGAAVDPLRRSALLRVRRVEVLVALGRALTECDRFPEAEATLNEALTAASDPRGEAAALHALGTLLFRTEQLPRAEVTLAGARARFRAIGDGASEGMVLRELGMTAWLVGRSGQARERYEQALVLLRAAGYLRFEAMVVANLALLDNQDGRLAEAEQGHLTALAVLPRIGARRFEAKTMANLALTLQRAGRLQESADWYERGIALLRSTGDRRVEAALLGNLAHTLGVLGEVERALTGLQEAVTLHRELGDRRFEGIALGNLASLLANEGRLEEGERLHEEALSIHRSLGNQWFEGFALGNLGELRCELGRLADARAALELALALARKLGDRTQEGLWLTHLGLVDALEDRPVTARENLDRGESLLMETGSPTLLVSAQLSRVRTLRVLGDLEGEAAAKRRAEELGGLLGLSPSAPMMQKIRDA